ncbi:immunity 17 family protein [Porphyromonas sp.]|uniref:immunity 17 family protein n=1 Tax=Porphyromonas sp. TaxID=1924944 RepID=UPI0026DAB4C7|nr:immunity 17 family protein [Porphyromonas sp.]MDO4771316.1 immunity 17 family protein [Porphyromonas sp.]
MSAAALVRIVLVVMFIIPGVIAFVAGATGSKWFFSSQGTRYFRGTFGMVGARIFYVILGLLLIGCGIYGLIDPEQLMRR